MTAAKRNHYDWPRYLVPPVGGISLDSNGFLRDPSDELGAIENPDLLELTDVLLVPVLVVLGEPGMGKSSLLRQIEGLTKSEGRTPITIDLATSASEERLHRRLTASEINGAGLSAPPADLLIDSFDTGLLSVPALSHLLSGVFAEYPKDADLRVRIACRSAVWPPSLQKTLEAKWGKDHVEVVEMAPLRRCDAASAARQGGLDPERFLREVEEHHAGVLAARPVTLLFLLNLARQGAPFPRTRVELYRQGCALLCAEENNARRESGRVGNRTPKERMMIAARIATVLLICNRESVWRGPHSELDSIRDCSVNDLVGPMLSPDDGAIQLTQQDVLETLDTGLFWLHGPQRSHFVHQSYAEFLAAWYLQEQRMSTARKLKLLSDAETGGLIPQLHEVAAWSAALDRDLFESLLEVHPPVLLASDTAMAAPELRAHLVGKILQLADSAQWTDTQWGIRSFYGQLCHPDIGSQLEPWIEDRGRFVVARRIAIDVAEACGLAELQDVLISVALDALDEASIRGQAIDALAAIGDQRHREMLRPLLALTSEKDPSDELRGDAMRALWPDCIDIRSLLQHLRPRSNPSHMGSYWRFMTEELSRSLSEADLAFALHWAFDLIADRESNEDSVRIAQAFADRGLGFLASLDESRQLAEPLQELAGLLLRLRKRAERLVPFPAAKGANHPLRDQAHRRQLLPFLLRRVQDVNRNAYLLVSSLYDEPAFIQADDVPWLLQLASTAASPTTCWTLCRLALQASTSTQYPEVYAACVEHPVMRRAIPELTRTIWLTSTRVQRARAAVESRRSFQRKLQRPPPDPPPQQRIAKTLLRIERGEVDAFIKLAVDDLALGDDGRFDRSPSADMRALNGWRQADQATRARVLAAALAYLVKSEPPLGKLVEIGRPLYATDAALRALFLVQHEDPGALDHVTPALWKRWAPVFLPRLVSVADRERVWADQLLRRAYEAAPNEIRDAVRRHLDRDIEVGGWQHTTTGLDPIWDEVLGTMVLRAAKAARATPQMFASLFRALMSNAQDLALNYGLHMVAALPEPPTETERNNAVLVADLLVTAYPEQAWPILWNTFGRDPAFGRSLILKLAGNWGDEGRWWTKLDDSQLGQLSLWVERTYARKQEHGVPRSGFSVLTPDRTWDLETLRSGLLETLVARGSPESVAAIERIAAVHPDVPWLRVLRSQAHESLRRTSWQPPRPAELLLLTVDRQKRLVRNGAELLNLVVESLERLQERLTEGWNPLVRCLWNECKGSRPKDENFLSDFVCDHLNRDLRGVAAQREVEARNRRGKGVGERTDILVTATATAAISNAEAIAVVIECKGCWNRELKTAMATQLKQRYLIDENHRFGIYLVGWFQCEAWENEADGRRRHLPGWTIEEATRAFQAQAEDLSSSGYMLRGVVLDLRLPKT